MSDGKMWEDLSVAEKEELTAMAQKEDEKEKSEVRQKKWKEIEAKVEKMDMVENAETDLTEFLSSMFDKYKIGINDELAYDYVVEHDFYSFLEKYEEYVKGMLQRNEMFKWEQQDEVKL